MRSAPTPSTRRPSARRAREMGDVIGDASILRAKIRLEIRAVLTPDQCKQVDQALDQISRSVTDALNGLANK